MTFDQISLVVDDVEETAKFFETFLKFWRYGDHNDNNSIQLTNKEHFNLCFECCRDLKPYAIQDSTLHFSVGSKAELRVLYKQFKHQPQITHLSYFKDSKSPTLYLFFNSIFICIDVKKIKKQKSVLPVGSLQWYQKN